MGEKIIVEVAALEDALRAALAWGFVYGPIIPGHQWDEMRESQVTQHVEALRE